MATCDNYVYVTMDEIQGSVSEGSVETCTIVSHSSNPFVSMINSDPNANMVNQTNPFLAMSNQSDPFVLNQTNPFMSPGEEFLRRCENQTYVNNTQVHSTPAQMVNSQVQNSLTTSVEFRTAQAEAAALGLSGDERRDYILQKMRVDPVRRNKSDIHVSSPRIRLDKWKIKDESMDCFVRRFERIASDLGWTEDVKLLHFVSCLEGRALEIYRRCDTIGTISYTYLLDQLEQAFGESATEKRKKFLNAMKSKDETPSQFICNTREKFVQWFNKSNKNEPMTVESLLNHIVREKVIESFPHDLQVKILQENLYNLEDIAPFSDHYYTSLKVKKGEEKKETGKDEKVMEKKAEKSGSSAYVNAKCFLCGKKGHISKHCFQKGKVVSAAVETKPKEMVEISKCEKKTKKTSR